MRISIMNIRRDNKTGRGNGRKRLSLGLRKWNRVLKFWKKIPQHIPKGEPTSLKTTNWHSNHLSSTHGHTIHSINQPERNLRLWTLVVPNPSFSQIHPSLAWRKLRNQDDALAPQDISQTKLGVTKKEEWPT